MKQRNFGNCQSPFQPGVAALLQQLAWICFFGVVAALCIGLQGLEPFCK